mmetsp:Transcript_7306/g.10912  ORF Transcript_7306/g.10912 Transcript_7306/m.10912 type:complete len:395 (-) Transcript_7306:49-1233(-)|eukprot:CAMPEP_0116033358 /NCGR_PEP_ID=MMETSP0321-20121206/18919_1 /TAXON_ID=163516 /ORGANISM="Leptocylindrus danicus var. danicus, Strain B650" /LENGTH=394 /DNA_ID=CAMNT_0003509373 /DNA_START=120 /DNA_END=1304 /DNA_ORIENTATION=+
MSSSNEYKTEIVKSLFGSSLGKAVLHFSCAFGAYTGRMYVCTNGVGYYSNMFGYERAITIYWINVTDIVKDKAYGIIFHEKDRGEQLFKSITDRDGVFNKMLRLLYRANPTLKEKKNIYNKLNVYNGRNDALIQVAGPSESDMETDWSQLKSASKKHFKYTALEKIDLPSFSMEIMFQKFFSDGAKRSMASFHRKIGDENIEASQWKGSMDGFHRTRTIKFERSRALFGVNKFTKYQHCRVFGSCGICIDTHEKINAMYDVKSRLLIDQQADGALAATVYCECVLLKRTLLLDALLEKTANETVTSWYKEYLEMICNSDRSIRSSIFALKREQKVDEKKISETRYGVALVVLMTLMIMYMLVMLQLDWQKIDEDAMYVQIEINLFREELEKVLQ